MTGDTYRGTLSAKEMSELKTMLVSILVTLQESKERHGALQNKLETSHRELENKLEISYKKLEIKSEASEDTKLYRIN
jgi:hypothetical protein